MVATINAHGPVRVPCVASDLAAFQGDNELYQSGHRFMIPGHVHALVVYHPKTRTFTSKGPAVVKWWCER